jgi:hypothetical protein
MSRRRARDQHEWADLISEYENSDLSVKAFCQGKSVGVASFYEWRKRLQDEAESCFTGNLEPSGRSPFIDIGEMGSAGISTSTHGSPWIVTLDLGGDLRLTLERR